MSENLGGNKKRGSSDIAHELSLGGTQGALDGHGRRPVWRPLRLLPLLGVLLWPAVGVAGWHVEWTVVGVAPVDPVVATLGRLASDQPVDADGDGHIEAAYVIAEGGVIKFVIHDMATAQREFDMVAPGPDPLGGSFIFIDHDDDGIYEVLLTFWRHQEEPTLFKLSSR